MTRPETRFAIVGAGYAGLTAALRLWRKGRRRGLHVTLIAPNDFFIEQIRMQDAATGAVLDPLPLADILAGTDIRHLRTRLTGIEDGTTPTARLESGEAEEFDRIILAPGWNFGPETGARPGEYWPVPHPTHGVASCAAHLASLGPGSRVAVIGGGTTGVELAGAVTTMRPDVEVTLASAGRAASFKGPRVERLIRDRLAARGVTIVDDVRAGVDRSEGEGLVLSGLEGRFDVVLHASGGEAPSLLGGLGLPADPRGAVLVDAELRSLGNRAVFAAGDCIALAEPPTTPFRRAAFTALATGAHAADNVLREHLGKPMRPFGFAWYGQGISLGRKDGVGFTAFPNDRPVGPVFTGAAAWHLRNTFVAALRHLVVAQKRTPWMLWWFPGHGIRQHGAPRRKAHVQRMD